MADSADGTLYVTGLPLGTDDDKVKAIFSTYGPVKSCKVLPPNSQKTDSAAIVSMESAAQAKLLIDSVSGTTPQGLSAPLQITAKKSPSWGKGGWGGGGGGYMDPYAIMQMKGWGKGWGFGGGFKGKGKGWGGGGGGLSSFPAEKKVWIGGIPEDATYQELQAHFTGSKFATVMKGKGAGTGGVAFGTPEEATAAIQQFNGSTFKEATIQVDVWTKKEPTPTEIPL